MTRVITSAAALLVVLVVGGCGGSDDGAETSAGTPSASASASASPSAGPSSSDPASSSSSSEPAATSTVAPAVGRRVETATLSVVVPDGWTGGDGATSSVLAAADFFSPEGTTNLSLFQVANPGAVGFEQAAKIFVGDEEGAKRVADRVIGGQQSFASEAMTATGRSYAFGRPVGTNIAEISFTFAPPEVTGKPEDLAAQRALVESVLATVQWKG